jgi:nitrite reductase/ring-hydroxylating ferredoxin subunit
MYVASWMLRERGQREAGVALAMAGYAVAGTSAWIGGHLSFVLGIGVSRDAFEQPPTKWRTALPEADLTDGEMKRVAVRGNPVVLLKQGDRVYATSATCTHVGGPLDEGELNGTCVTCPWHGSEFDLRNGHVLHGPATADLHAYETRVSDGNVQIRELPK